MKTTRVRRYRKVNPKYFNPNNLQQRVVSAVLRFVSESSYEIKDIKSLRKRLQKFAADDKFWLALEQLVKVGTDINKALKGMYVNID